MNINITNYPVNNNFKINKKNNNFKNISAQAYPPTLNSKQAQSVNFTGLPTFLMKRQTREGIRDYLSRTGYYVGISPKKLREDFSIKTLADSAVLYRLTEKYRNNGNNFLNLDNAYEAVAKVYNKIKKPTMELNWILKISRKSLDDFSNIFDAIGDDKNKLKLFYQLNSLKSKNGSKLSIKTDDFINILSSDNAKKLSKNFNKYRSYIELNHRNNDFSEKLLQELELSKPSFSEKEIQNKIAFRKIQRESMLFEYLPKNFLEENYNSLGVKLFGNFKCAKDNLLPNGENIVQKDLDFFKYVINSTTKKNIKERAHLFINDINIRMSKNTNDEIMELFKRIDSDKNFKKLYNKVADARIIQDVPIREFLLYADTFGSKKLLKNSDNFSKILKYSEFDKKDPTNIIETISKNLNNKFYITRREIQSEMESEYFTRNKYLFTGNLRANFHRFKRIFKHETLPKIFGTGKEIPVDMQALQPKIDKLNIAKAEREKFFEEMSKQYEQRYNIVAPEPKPIPGQTTVPTPAPKPVVEISEKPIDKPETPVVEKAINSQETDQPQKIKIKRDYKAEKLRIKQEAQDIIKAKIHSKKDYSAGIKRFTKMRNSFLKDMFASVKETRAYQRAQGIKKPTVSNQDVITLYEKINGKNKHLAKYFLNSRTSDGNREFTVRQVANLLDEIKAKRPTAKTTNNK